MTILKMSALILYIPRISIPIMYFFYFKQKMFQSCRDEDTTSGFEQGSGYRL